MTQQREKIGGRLINSLLYDKYLKSSTIIVLLTTQLENCTIDEMLEPFRGRCPFRQFIKSKPAKYGLKIYALADSKTFFANKMEVYCGRQQQGPYNVSNSAKDVVLRLVQPISQSGRNVTVDNFFCSIPLCDELVQDHKLLLDGNVRKNKRELPEIVTQHTNRPVYSSLFFLWQR